MLRRRTRVARPGEPILIRPSRPEDGPALARLAELDERILPAGPFLLAESRGRLVAALPLDGGAPIADPFLPTAGVTELLVVRARQLATEPLPLAA
jgi:hypothetical protein